MYCVYVLNKHGEPLMPCSPRKARVLLREGKAIVIKRTPFVIQLLYGSSGYRQKVILGVDAGSKTIGLSASTANRELFAAEVKPRNDIVEKLSTRRQFRRARRSRKTRYRKARFDNRTKSKPKGWHAPSVEVKIQNHITPVKKVCAILPVSKVVVETAEFDFQLLKAIENGDPPPQGLEYQHGEMYGFYNTRQYVLWRDGYACRCCGAKSTEKKSVKFHVHRLESAKTGGNAPDNLITLCEDCHKRFHSGILDEEKLKKRRRKSTRDAAFMGIMRSSLIDRLRSELAIEVCETKGAFTKGTRERLLMLPKTHINDALAIAHGLHGFGISGPKAIQRCNNNCLIKPVRHHNRQLHRATILKGDVRKNNQAPRYVFGFRLWDKVLYGNQECFVTGRRTSGSFALKKLDGTSVTGGISHKKLHALEKSANYLVERV